MAKSICALTMALSVNITSCLNDKSTEVTQEIQFIPASCSTEVRDVLVQNLYLQVLQQRCSPDSYKITIKGCQGETCFYIVPKEAYMKR